MKRLAALRTARGWTQKELGERLGVSTSTIGMCESNRREPSNTLLVKIAQLFGVSTDYLLGVAPPSEMPPQQLPPPLSPREEELLAAFRAMLSEHQETLLSVARGLATAKQKRQTLPKSTTSTITDKKSSAI